MTAMSIVELARRLREALETSAEDIDPATLLRLLATRDATLKASHPRAEIALHEFTAQ